MQTDTIQEFQPFPKIARLSRTVVVTEKIDGTNGVVWIDDTGTYIKVGGRTRWLTDHEDNYGFYKWCMENRDELLKLGPGFHYGEWWGRGIQRNYGLQERRFSLFNTSRWSDAAVRPACCHVVPVLFAGPFDINRVGDALMGLATTGSVAAPGFMKPEGVVVFHPQAKVMFKKTIEKDDEPKTAHSQLP